MPTRIRWRVTLVVLALTSTTRADPTRAAADSSSASLASTYYTDPPASLDEASEWMKRIAVGALRACVGYSIANHVWTDDSDDCERQLAALTNQTSIRIDEFMPVASMHGELRELWPPVF